MTLFNQVLQTYVASIETIYFRTLHLMPVWGSLTPWQVNESKRMVSEKKDAWGESQLQIALAPWSFAMHVNMQLWRAALEAGTSPLLGITLTPSQLNLPQVLRRASEATLAKTLKPYRIRTTKNAKRLKQRVIGMKR